MSGIIIILSLTLFNQTPLLNESFTNETFPPAGWDTLRSSPVMNNWYRYYYSTGNPDNYQARVRVYDASDTLRTGWTTLKTIGVNLADATEAESLFFWYRFSTDYGNLGPDDTMYIDISNDDMNWSNLLKIGSGADTNVWHKARLDLSPYDTYDNARIRFHYDDRPNGVLSTFNCNFWLDSVQIINYDTIPHIWPIAQAFQDLDSNYVPDFLNTIVTITGVVTAPPGIFSNSEAYIQDHSGGVCLYGNYPTTLDYGDSIVAIGTVEQYQGKSELANHTYTVIGSGTLPEPIDVNGSILTTEQYEGSLVRVKVSHIDGFLLEGQHSYSAWDTLNNQFTIWIDSYTNIPGSLAPVDTFTLTGIKGQYTDSSPPDDGYQLMPRDTSDFSHLFTPVTMTIGEVQDVGPDGVSSKYEDSIVTVEGVVTGPNYVFTAGSPSFYIQDGTGGVNVYNAQGDSLFDIYMDSLGARLRVTGTVTEYRGLTEVANGYGWFVNMDTVPSTKRLLPNRFLTEGMESQLIEMRGVVRTVPYQTGDGYNFDVLNGNAGITVRFTTGSGINPLSISKDEERILTGIVGQYDPEAPYTTGYQLLLRFADDIVVPGNDSTSSEPELNIVGPKTFIPGIGEQAEIEINSPLDYRLDLNVHNMSGKLVKRLYSGAGGPNTVYWDGKDDFANPCKIGIYLLNLKAVSSTGNSMYRRNLIVIGAQ